MPRLRAAESITTVAALSSNVESIHPVAELADVATYQGNSASYSHYLFVVLNSSGLPGDDGDPPNDLFIFNNHTSAVGSTVNLGPLAIGTELEFRLFVHNTGNNFCTGPAGRNPDSNPHARVQQNWQPNATLVSFEDLFNGPFN